MSSRIGNRWILAVALAGLSLPAATAEAAQAAEARVAQAAQPEAEAAYREAREALSRGDYERAAAMFESYRSRFPQATHLPDAYYWQAFSLYRLGSLRESLELLEAQLSAFSEEGIGRDARELELRIRALLAGQGDAAAAERASRDIASALVTGRAEQAERAAAEVELAAEWAEAVEAQAVAAAEAVAPIAEYSVRARMAEADQEGCGDDDVRRAAINALMQMGSDRAVPVLRRVLERRDECSAPLRKQAVFVLAQHGGADVEDVMLEVVRNDPDSEVREAAVFWLSQVGTERAVDALADVLATSDDPDIQDKAVFALSQHSSDRAGQILRDYAVDASKPERIREQAIFWLSQHPSHANSQFLIDLYASLDSANLKEKVLFSLSQRGDPGAIDWLIARARDSSEEVEVRKKALFWAVQGGADLTLLDGLYESLPDREMKEQVIFLYAQRDGSEAVGRLIEIARAEQDPELRKKAIFWLGQTGDERAAQFLLELLEEEPR